MFIEGQDLCSTEPIIISFPVTICKADVSTGIRLFEVEASNQHQDSEGDIISQKSLLDAAPGFIQNGVIDLDHKSELAKNPAWAFLRLGDPRQYVIGKPLDVFDMGDGRTGVKAQIFESVDGSVDPIKNKYDEFWCSLTGTPKVDWYASIFGFPTEIEKGTLAKRFFVKSIRWNSMAVTRRPINESMIGPAHVVSKSNNLPQIVMAKSYAAALALNNGEIVNGLEDFSRTTLLNEYKNHIVSKCDCIKSLTIQEIRDHFMKCRSLSYEISDLCALAMTTLLENKRFR